jgi:hypothetical protein
MNAAAADDTTISPRRRANSSCPPPTERTRNRSRIVLTRRRLAPYWPNPTQMCERTRRMARRRLLVVLAIFTTACWLLSWRRALASV